MRMILISILENMGYLVMEPQNDFDIRDYIIDSIQFMEFIIGIESVLQFELTDDFLNYDLLASMDAFANKVECYKDNVINDNTTINNIKSE